MPKLIATVVLEVTNEILVEAGSLEQATAIIETCNFANQVAPPPPEADMLCMLKTLAIAETKDA